MPGDKLRPLAVVAAQMPLRTKPSPYPEPFFSRMSRREKRPLGDLFGLKNFGVNLTRLAPGGESSLLHRHSRQDEFVYILERKSYPRHRVRGGGPVARHVRGLPGARHCSPAGKPHRPGSCLSGAWRPQRR